MNYNIRMQIFLESENLLSQRKFHVDWDGAETFKLSDVDDHLI
jgi:hypothetical protein